MKGEPAPSDGPEMEDYEKTWLDHWAEDMTRSDGTLDPDKVKRELHDYWFLLENVPVVYEHVTVGMLSKPNYDASTIISVHDERCQESTMGVVRDDVKEILPAGTKLDEMRVEELRQAVREALEYLGVK